jgi:hypothetical protein
MTTWVTKVGRVMVRRRSLINKLSYQDDDMDDESDESYCEEEFV